MLTREGDEILSVDAGSVRYLTPTTFIGEHELGKTVVGIWANEPMSKIPWAQRYFSASSK